MSITFTAIKNDCIFQQSSMSQGTYPLTLAERRSQKRTNVEIPKEESHSTPAGVTVSVTDTI